MSSQQYLDILVVDRDEGAMLQLKEVLTQEGYRVNQIADPTLVANEVRNNRYQLVILDVSPGNPSGVEALRKVRVLDDDLCVIATTDMPSVEMAVSTMKQNAYHYLQKPIDEQELRAVIKEAIKEKGLLVDLETRLNSVVGQRIREKRHAFPLTLKQLANRTGLSVSLISQIELGKSAASMSTLHKLANALGVKMTFFFEMV
jgi:two-component system OmpR family response regulator